MGVTAEDYALPLIVAAVDAPPSVIAIRGTSVTIMRPLANTEKFSDTAKTVVVASEETVMATMATVHHRKYTRHHN